MINWRVRIKNRAFWLSLIPAVLLLLQQALRLCGVDFDPGQLEGQLTGLAGTVFSILALLGIVADPTTPGIRDCCEKHAAEEAENPEFSNKKTDFPAAFDEKDEAAEKPDKQSASPQASDANPRKEAPDREA